MFSDLGTRVGHGDTNISLKPLFGGRGNPKSICVGSQNVIFTILYARK